MEELICFLLSDNKSVKTSCFVFCPGCQEAQSQISGSITAPVTTLKMAFFPLEQYESVEWINLSCYTAISCPFGKKVKHTCVSKLGQQQGQQQEPMGERGEEVTISPATWGAGEERGLWGQTASIRTLAFLITRSGL